jgi:transcriptional regulator with GAF, ATPase, and Fis domain
LDIEDLPSYLQPPAMSVGPRPVVVNSCAADALEEGELRLVVQALEQTGQNQARAARLLRTSRDRLRYKMKKYGLLSEPSVAACA